MDERLSFLLEHSNQIVHNDFLMISANKKEINLPKTNLIRKINGIFFI